MPRLLLPLAAVVLVGAGDVALAAGDYAPAVRRCGFADAQIAESSGVAASSWADDVVWTHNDSGDQPRFFAVETVKCTTLGVYDVTDAVAVDWEDMAAAGATLYFGDIGDNAKARPSITVYVVPEPRRGTPSGAVSPSSVRTFTYPDGAHNAESLLVDPTTGRLVIVTKPEQGPSVAYRAPAEGNGELEKVAEVTIPGLTTGGDASAERIVIRNYAGAFEWDVRARDTLAEALARPPVPIALPLTKQGEAIAYTRDGFGLWTTSESVGGPVHFLGGTPEPEPVPTVPPREAKPDDDSDVPVLAVLVVAALIFMLVLVLRRRGRREEG